MPGPIRMLLIGPPGGEFRRAAELAREAGAAVDMADDVAQALALLRATGGELAMIDVDADVAGFIASLRSERFGLPVLACGIDASAERAVAAIRAGARDYVPLPPHRELIAAAIASVVERRNAESLGSHPALVRALDLATAVAPRSIPVLVTGEKGCGKATLARAIHGQSGREGPSIVVECAGVPAEILESELFGHEAGAFPGAVARRIGALEKAAGGSLMLREVSALAPALQARLQEALEAQRFVRIGGSVPVPVSARLIASTSADLDARVEHGSFRADLLARLGLVRIEVPPLRERGGDIAALAGHFAARAAAQEGLRERDIADAALVLMRRYAWPGNVRELEESIQRAFLLGSGPRIEAEDLLASDGTPLVDLVGSADALTPRIEGLVGRTVEEVERELILQTLERCRGNRTSASTILGISVRTMRNKLRTFIEAGIAVSPAP